ncbi:MAG TPA: 50S ribosome-binding GTPase [candidate division Zixibacteria bacterium]|nr:50S ribosome-binding GTPase [candidate division Zixibacteria bacterium]
MPANLPPQYYELEREFRAERDTREKLRIAEELLRIMPKHKGTDKLQAEMKAKISKLKKQLEGTVKSGGPVRSATAFDHIPKEGAGQVILIGPPNSGKSSLVDSLTGAAPLIGDYPFTTREPLAGMMKFETIQIQLIDTPPISPESYENYLSGLIRNADVAVMVADLAAPTMASDLRFVLDKLEEKRILLTPTFAAQPDDPRFCPRKTIVCAHKIYDDETGERLTALEKMFPGFVLVKTSIIDDDTLAVFRRALFDSLDIIRVYTKPIGKESDRNDPVILPLESTVEQAAESLHKDFAKKLKFAKIWGSGKFEGQRVQKDFVLSDEDIIEFHV